MYRGSKFFKYADPVPLDELHAYFQKHSLLKIKGKNLEGETKLLEHKITITHFDKSLGLFGFINYRDRQKANDSDDFIWKYSTFDFIIFREPSVLILHGSTLKMRKIIEGLDNAINPNDPNDDFNDPSSFGGYSRDQRIDKYVIKKISKKIEDKENVLYDPHFQELRDNSDARGGECFYRRDRTSATLDEKFCYLFELCAYWEPEFYIRNCGGIVSSISTPYNMIITSDLALKFKASVKKEELDQFWMSIVIPIIQEDDYSTEKTECVENARNYSDRLKKMQ